jgi:threonylcarbamoyladenosine tRNA methylthiotransferase MtaB
MEMKQMTVSIATLGCKVNHQESEKLAGDFRALGFSVVGIGEPADVCIINSCTVTSVADAKTRQRIRQARAKSPHALVCVIGCMPEVSREAATAMQEIDLVIGSKEKHQTAALAAAALQDKTSANQDKTSVNPESTFVIPESTFVIPGLTRDPQPPPDAFPPSGARTRAFLKAEDGCDQYCAYCIIPTARGAVRSKPMEEILTEATALLTSGYREIVLTGINLARYGADFERQGDGSFVMQESTGGSLPLSRLLTQLTDIHPGHEYRIRLGSLEPTVIDVAEAQAIAALPGICPHFHLSLQSGSDRTLERMGRHYDAKAYSEILQALRAVDPHFAVTTDVIVGFPGETEEDFADSLAFVENAHFAKVHVFPYSPRRGTRAAEMPDPVPELVKKARAAAMTEAGNRTADAFLTNCFGETRRTLSFGPDKAGRIRGLTDNGIDVRIPTNSANIAPPKENEFFDLTITREITLSCE